MRLAIGFGALLVAGCSPLSTEDAKTLIEAQLGRESAVSCAWTGTTPVSPSDARRVAADPDEGQGHLRDSSCLDQLVRAGMVKRGECHVTGPQGCLSRIVEPAGGARFDDGAVTFACGELKLVDIKAIKKIDDSVYVTFDREFTKGPVLDDLSACRGDTFFKSPSEGKLERQRTLTRKPEGGRSVSSPPPAQR